MSDRWRELLAPRMVEVIEREIEDAYRKGWADCRRALLRALEEVEKRSFRNRSDGASVTVGHGAVGRRPRAARGFWQDRIVEVLRERGTSLTSSELLKAIAERTSLPVSRTSLHSALQTLRKRGRIDRRNGRWQLAEGDPGFHPLSDVQDG